MLVIIPCGKSKIWDRYPKSGAVPARLAYTSGPFKVNQLFAKRSTDTWIILSAKYGFIRPDFIIPGPYEVSFKLPKTNPIGVETLRDQIKGLGEFDRIVAIGGSEYRRIISEAFYPVIVEFPFAGLSIGKTMQAVKKATPALAQKGCFTDDHRHP